MTCQPDFDCVCILDPKSTKAHIYTVDDAWIADAEQEVTFPGTLEGFRVKVSEFFRD